MVIEGSGIKVVVEVMVGVSVIVGVRV